MSGTRREELAAAATDYALSHGLIGLSLRPVAAALGTSDRMLLYHFGTKDELVSAILRGSTERAIAELRALAPAPDVPAAVTATWEAMQSGTLERCERLYVEAAALGLLGEEPYTSVVRETNGRWLAVLSQRLVDAGCRQDRSRRAAVFLDAAFMGLQLDLPLDRESPERAQAVEDLAAAVAGIASAEVG